MRPTRRHFVAGLSALSAGIAGCPSPSDPTTPIPPTGTGSPDREPEPPPWVPEGDLDEASFAWSVQSGDVTPTAALLSVRTTEDVVGLTLMRAVGVEGWEEVAVWSDLSADTGVVALEATDLAPDTAYRFVAHTADGTRRSQVGRFRTALDVDQLRTVVFGATSCLGTQNPDWDNLTQAAGLDLDFFLFLGDAVYADGAVTVEDYRNDWRQATSTPSLAALTASTSMVALWDDHEVNNNWYFDEGPVPDGGGTASAVQIASGTEAFREAMPQRIGPGGSGMWRRLSWGAVLDVIVLDSRGERDGLDRIVSDAQLDWAVEAIRTSTARFTLVLCSVHLADHFDLWGTVEAIDRWQGYPDQRLTLVRALEETPGVVVLTGDMHYGSVHRLSPANEPGADIWEVAVGPSGSRLNELVDFFSPTDQYPMMLADHSCCVFTADPVAGTLTVDFVGDDGDVLASQVLTP